MSVSDVFSELGVILFFSIIITVFVHSFATCVALFVTLFIYVPAAALKAMWEWLVGMCDVGARHVCRTCGQPTDRNLPEPVDMVGRRNSRRRR